MSGAENSRIINGDVLEVLRGMPPDETFDVVIADPPYNIGKDFGNNHDAMPLGDYVEWMQEWIAECLGRLNPAGLLYVYDFPEILARVSANYDIDSQRWLQWHYTNKTVPSSKFWQRSHESILCLWRQDEKRPALEIDQIREPYKPAYLKVAGKTRKGTFGRYGGGGKSTVYNAHKNGALPRDVIKAPALAGRRGACRALVRLPRLRRTGFPSRRDCRTSAMRHAQASHPKAEGSHAPPDSVPRERRRRRARPSPLRRLRLRVRRRPRAGVGIRRNRNKPGIRLARQPVAPGARGIPQKRG